jgi:hypothetical protein
MWRKIKCFSIRFIKGSKVRHRLFCKFDSVCYLHVHRSPGGASIARSETGLSRRRPISGRNNRSFSFLQCPDLHSGQILLLTNGYRGPKPEDKAAGVGNLTTHLHLVKLLIASETIPPLPIHLPDMMLP